jgi:hypothetical protein
VLRLGGSTIHPAILVPLIVMSKWQFRRSEKMHERFHLQK